MRVTVDCPICEDEDKTPVGRVECWYAYTPGSRMEPDNEEFEVEDSSCDCWEHTRAPADMDCLRDLALDVLDNGEGVFDPRSDGPENDDDY